MRRVLFVKADEQYIPAYCKRTVIEKDTETGKISVYKEASTKAGIDHLKEMADAASWMADVFPSLKICPCWMEDSRLYMPFIEHNEKWLHRLLAVSNDRDQLISTWKQFFHLLEPSYTVPFHDSEVFDKYFGNGRSYQQMESYPMCAWDITPSNVIAGESEHICFDYEWIIPSPVPLSLLKYHVVSVTIHSHPQLLACISEDELLQKLGLYEHLDDFRASEEHFLCHLYGATSITRATPLFLHYKRGESNVYQLMEESRQLDHLKHQMQQMQEQHQSLIEAQEELLKEKKDLARQLDAALSDNHIAHRKVEALTHELKRTQDQLLLAWNSRSWKITAPLRFLKRIKEEKKNPVIEIAKKLKERNIPEEVQATDEPQSIWMPEPIQVTSRSTSVFPSGGKRLAIMYFFDRDGIVDEYALILMKDIRRHVDTLVVVAGGTVNEDGRQTLQKACDQLYMRPNQGFDMWGYRDGLLHVGWDRLRGFDEVILLNFTIMGPVSSISSTTMFQEMNQRDVDFWGITAHPGFDFDPFGCNPYGEVPEHIQSYFLAFRKQLTTHPCFQKFWESLPPLENYNQAVGKVETVLTHYFAQMGFKWDAYVNRKQYYSLTDNPLMTMPMELIRDMGCPFFKRRVFFQDYDYYISYTCGQTASQLLHYLEAETDYNTDIIWENILRTCHMSDLQENLHLTKILPCDRTQQTTCTLRSAAVIHLFDVKMAEEIRDYCRSLPPETDVYISTTDDEKKEAICRIFSVLPNHVTVRVFENRGRDVSCILAGFRQEILQYDVICVTHDKRTSHLKPYSVGEGFAYMGYENILSSSAYVSNILYAFEQDRHLGMLVTPSPVHADFGSLLSHEWGQNFGNTKRLADELHIHVPMDNVHFPCAPFGSNFWIRKEALLPLYRKQWTYQDFPTEPIGNVDGTILQAIERIYPYCAQEAGFYTATVMTEKYSALEMANLQYYASGWATMCAKHNLVGRFIDVRNTMDSRIL